MTTYSSKKQTTPKVEESEAIYSGFNYSSFSIEQLKSIKEDLELEIELRETEEEMNKGEFYTEEEMDIRFNKMINKYKK